MLLLLLVLFMLLVLISTHAISATVGTIFHKVISHIIDIRQLHSHVFNLLLTAVQSVLAFVVDVADVVDDVYEARVYQHRFHFTGLTSLLQTRA